MDGEFVNEVGENPATVGTLGGLLTLGDRADLGT
jgi:hypothetical protein